MPSKGRRRRVRCGAAVSNWIEGNDEVKVLGVWGHQPSHMGFAIIEADDFAAVTALLRQPMLAGKTQVLPVNDNIVLRKQRGQWGT